MGFIIGNWWFEGRPAVTDALPAGTETRHPEKSCIGILAHLIVHDVHGRNSRPPAASPCLYCWATSHRIKHRTRSLQDAIQRRGAALRERGGKALHLGRAPGTPETLQLPSSGRGGRNSRIDTILFFSSFFIFFSFFAIKEIHFKNVRWISCTWKLSSIEWRVHIRSHIWWDGCQRLDQRWHVRGSAWCLISGTFSCAAYAYFLDASSVEVTLPSFVHSYIAPRAWSAE